MDIVVESKVSGTAVARDLQLFRTQEPLVTGHFATLVHQRRKSQLHVMPLPPWTNLCRDTIGFQGSYPTLKTKAYDLRAIACARPCVLHI
jgi:hypothetical protein